MSTHSKFLRFRLKLIRTLLNICIGCFYSMSTYSLIMLASYIDLQETNTFLLIFPALVFTFVLLLYGAICQYYAFMKRNCSQQWLKIISYNTVANQADINALPTQFFSLVTQAASFSVGLSLMMMKEVWFNSDLPIFASITERAYLEGLLITGAILQSIFCALGGFTPLFLAEFRQSLESSSHAEAAESWAEIL